MKVSEEITAPTENKGRKVKLEMKQDPGRQNQFKIYPAATMYGLTAGLLMGIYLIMLQMIEMDSSISLKFLKYIVLIGVLGWGLHRYRQQNANGTFFANGIRIGALATLISAATLIVINVLVSLVMPEWAFNKFNLAIDSPGTFLITSGAIFFEVLVFGMVSTFIWLQYLKNRIPSEA